MYIIKKLFFVLGSFIIIGICLVIAINVYVCESTRSQTKQEIADADCILVLGAGIRNNSPSPMLNDRLEAAIQLYKEGKAKKIIMSGDHGSDDYNEVAVMKRFAIEKGVPSSDIFMDHAGFSTYESVYRAKNIFKVNKMIIVTQDYHLYRALYIANSLGVEAVGVPSNPREYSGQQSRDIREIAARCKDFLTAIYKPEPTHLGESIPVSGNGDDTNDTSF